MATGPIVLMAVLSLALSGVAAAQAPDPLLAGYSFSPESVGSRPAGMGGAFVALADDTKAAVANPAGLTLIPLTEISLSSGERWAAASSGRVNFRLAAYLTRADATAPALDSEVREGGLAAGVRPFRRVNLGLGVAWSRLTLATNEGAAPGTLPARADDTQARFTAGVLMDLLGVSRGSLPALRLGVSYQPGFDWSLPLASSADGGSSPLRLRRPTLLSAGLAYRPADLWTLTAQADLIRYREVLEALRRSTVVSGEWNLPDALEPRLGLEYSAPLWCGCGVVKLRGGVHYRSAGSLRYAGGDPALAAAFGHDPWQTVATLGGSFFTEHFGHALRFDVDSKDVFSGPDLSFGVVIRF